MSKYDDFDLNLNKVKGEDNGAEARSATELFCEVLHSIIESENDTCGTCVTDPSRGCDDSDITNCC